VKAGNFRNSRNKKAYAYLLTPKGIEDKARITVQFLKLKLAEHEALTKEIKGLREEALQVQAFQSAASSFKKGKANG
jgi:hypothetical protein